MLLGLRFMRIPPLALALAIAAGLPGTAAGQFFGLATPADGSQIYFVTPLSQRNTNQSRWGKLFEIDSSGLKLKESRDRYVVRHDPVYDITTTNPYDIRGASFSSDGQVVAVTGWLECIGSIYCSHLVENYQTTITVQGESTSYPGNLQLSPNGEWAFGNSSHRPDEHLFPVTVWLVNVKTGKTTGLNAGEASTSGRSVSNDGTAVMAGETGVGIIRGEKTLFIPVDPGSPVGPVIDAPGRNVVYAVCSNRRCSPPGSLSLYIADAISGASRLVASDGYAPSITDDGLRVLYISTRTGTPQLWMIGVDGSGDRQLSDDAIGIEHATMSGDGSTAYAVTLGGRLLRFDTMTGTVEELIPRTPYVGTDFVVQTLFLASTKLSRIAGVGFSDSSFTASAPLPDRFAGVSVTIQGKPGKIMSVEPTAITILAPPDLTFEYPATVELRIDSPSPFEAPANPVAYLSRYDPEFLSSPGRPEVYQILAAHQDWSGVVSPANPARQLELVHAYAVGLGPTVPAVPYGAAAPDRPPFAVLSPGLTCYGLVGRVQVPVELMFQGLAPGLVGVYQLDILIPLEAPDGDFPIQCGIPLVGIIPVHHAPGQPGPPPALAPVSVTPQNGAGTQGAFTFQFVDPKGWADLDFVNILFSPSLDPIHACYLGYSRPLNLLYLVNDAGTALLPEATLTTPGTLQNSQCGVDLSGSYIASDGYTFTLTLNMSFTPSFAGSKLVSLAARDHAQQNTGWMTLGSWLVPGN